MILVGDDMAHGNGFSVEQFTGLTFVNNGTSMSCGGQTFYYDNLSGHNYQITLNEEFLSEIPIQFREYEYGNDIDATTPQAGVQVLG